MRWFALFSDNKSEAQRKGIWFLPNSQLLCSRVRSLAGSFGGFIRPLLLYAVGFSLQPCTLCWFCWQVPCAFGGTGTPYTCIWEGPPPHLTLAAHSCRLLPHVIARWRFGARLSGILFRLCVLLLSFLPSPLLFSLFFSVFPFLFLFFFFGRPVAYGVPRPGITSELQL